MFLLACSTFPTDGQRNCDGYIYAFIYHSGPRAYLRLTQNGVRHKTDINRGKGLGKKKGKREKRKKKKEKKKEKKREESVSEKYEPKNTEKTEMLSKNTKTST